MKDILPAKVVTRKRKKCMFRVWNRDCEKKSVNKILL